MSHVSSFKRSYADFGFYRSYRQLRDAVGKREGVQEDMGALLKQVKVSEQRMESVAGRPIKSMDILEIGPGQGMERATYFGRNNQITSLDTDVIPFGFEPANYLRMLKANGLGRFSKTLGREVVIGRRNRAAWKTLIDAEGLARPKRLFGNICEEVPAQNAFDCVMSWSVFEHVSDPEQALDHVLAALRPGGIFYISLHLYTCNNGHHDIRSFTSAKEEVPLWGHLRQTTKHLIKPSAYLNEWRLGQWRELFARKASGFREELEKFEHPMVYGPRIAGQLASELKEYSLDELLTVNVVYFGRKPLS